MSTILPSKPAQDALSARTTTALRIVVGVSLLAACVMVLAESDVAAPAVAPADLSLDQLERAFWACEHAAVTRGVSSGEGMACGIVTEAFKAQRFGGNFEAMLQWWREHKDAALPALQPADDGVAAAAAGEYPDP